MKARDAVLHAFSGTPISHKDFADKSRYIVATQTREGLELVDTASDAPACWKLLIDHYGKHGWVKFKGGPVKVEAIQSINGQESFVDSEYLSNQIEELTDLLDRVLAIVEDKE